MGSGQTGQTVKKGTAKTKAPDAWRPAFLASLAETCNVSEACRVSGISRPTVYEHRAADAEFAAAWDDAVAAGVEALELTARQRAVRESDTLLIFLLKAHRPDVYRENRRTELTGANGGPVETRIVFGYDDGAGDDSDG